MESLTSWPLLCPCSFRAHTFPCFVLISGSRASPAPDSELPWLLSCFQDKDCLILSVGEPIKQAANSIQGQRQTNKQKTPIYCKYNLMNAYWGYQLGRLPHCLLTPVGSRREAKILRKPLSIIPSPHPPGRVRERGVRSYLFCFSGEKAGCPLTV